MPGTLLGGDCDALRSARPSLKIDRTYYSVDRQVTDVFFDPKKCSKTCKSRKLGEQILDLDPDLEPK